MLTMNDLNPLLRRRSTVIAGEGEKVGTVGVVYLNDVDEQPTWVTVHTGLFGSRESFVPLEGASIRNHDLVVAYSRELIRHAPSVDRDGHLSPEEEAALYRHYGMQATAPPRAQPAGEAIAASPAQSSVDGAPGAAHAGSEAGAAASAVPARTTVPTPAATAPEAPPTGPRAAASSSLDGPAAAPVIGHARREREGAEHVRPAVSETAQESATSGDVAGASAPSGVRTHDDGGTPWVVRSEERLRVGTEQYEAGRVRLRKYVVTEEEAVSVPLVTEEVRVVVEPITSGTAVDLGTAFREESVELVAREEIAVVATETVAVERVRMRTVEVAGRATVRDTVRKERISIAVDGDAVAGAGSSDRTPARRTKSAKAGAASGTASKPSVKGTPKNTPKSSNALVKGKKKRR